MTDNVFEFADLYLKFSNIKYIEYIPKYKYYIGIFKYENKCPYYKLYYDDFSIKLDIESGNEIIEAWKLYCKQHG